MHITFIHTHILKHILYQLTHIAPCMHSYNIHLSNHIQLLAKTIPSENRFSCKHKFLLSTLVPTIYPKNGKTLPQKDKNLLKKC